VDYGNLDRGIEAGAVGALTRTGNIIADSSLIIFGSFRPCCGTTMGELTARLRDLRPALLLQVLGNGDGFLLVAGEPRGSDGDQTEDRLSQ